MYPVEIEQMIVKLNPSKDTHSYKSKQTIMFCISYNSLLNT